MSAPHGNGFTETGQTQARGPAGSPANRTANADQLGLVLAHQHLGQLPEALKTAVLSTARTQLAFQLDYDDATTLSRSFGPLTRDDLMGLEQFEAAVRPCVNGRTMKPVTVSTLALPTATTDVQELAARSREHYGVPRAEVEAALRARLTTSERPDDEPGRERHGDGA